VHEDVPHVDDDVLKELGMTSLTKKTKKALKKRWPWLRLDAQCVDDDLGKELGMTSLR